LHSVPGSRDPLDSILDAFSAKGFDGKDVVALMGTHSVAFQFFDDPSQAGKTLDSTPSVYDVTFYKETKEGTAPYTLQSDKLLSNSSQVCFFFFFFFFFFFAHLPVPSCSLTWFTDGRHLEVFH